MSLRINQNIAAMNAYRNLGVNDSAMSKSLEKLSSGFRINRAADDAAGLVVSENLRSQVGGLKVAVRNSQDGISVVQTAEGALNEVHSILQRMRDLAVQAANTGSQDPTATQAAQKEIDQLKAEIDRIGGTTAFGSAKLLDGTFGNQHASVAGATQIGSLTVDHTASTPNNSLNIAVDGGSAVAVTVADGTYTADAAGASSLEKALQTGINATALNGKVTAQVTYDTVSHQNVVSLSSNSVASTGGVTLSAVSSNSGLTALGFSQTGSALADATHTSTGGIFQVGANNSANDRIAVSIAKVDSTALNVASLDVTNASNAQAAIDSVDTAINSISDTRASLGAAQNRFEHTIANLNVAVENVSASESRIRDVDMAQEMVSYTRNQIMTQAGTAMLAQANSAPQNVLQLLRG